MADSIKLVEPQLQFSKRSFRSSRLINFPTGQDGPVVGVSKGWLEAAVRAIPGECDFAVYIVGQASKPGYLDQSASDPMNLGLSYSRASSVARIMERINPRVTTNITQFEAKGNTGYSARDGDNSPDRPAVDVHFFLGARPKPPPSITPERPCPGGHRYLKWSIATPSGISFNPALGAALANNVVVFRREDGDSAIHSYMAAGFGAGQSNSGPRSEGLKGIIQTFLGSLNYMGMFWSKFTADTPFKFGDLEGAACRIISDGASVAAGYQQASVTVNGAMWCCESRGKCMFGQHEFFSDVDTSGKTFS